MGLIQKLPDDVAIKIAAGEVVERPASVVKELIENALDAGASKIDVEITDGGRTKIVVRDNGRGMDAADAEAAFWRHGTSKIASIDDLHRVATLGFRGEALAAIAETSHVILQTAEPDRDVGHEVTVSFGSLSPVKPHPPVTGTTVTVTRLFESIPARLKFLKSDATEWKACVEIVIRQMLAHPAAAFLVKHNGRVIFDLAANQTLRARMAAVAQIDEDRLIDVAAETAHYRVAGVVASPQIAHEVKPRQYLAVNGHPINDKAVARAIKDAFGTLLPPGIQPSYVLDLHIHPGMVDVNVHPRKEEARFVNSQEVFRLVHQAVSQALTQSRPVFTAFSPSVSSDQSHRDGRSADATADNRHPAFRLKPIIPARSGFHPAIRPLAHREKTIGPGPAVKSPGEMPPEPIIQLDACWLITAYGEKLVIIDQHAGHERVLYNRLWRDYHDRPLISQRLLVPHPLSLDPSDQAKADEHRLALRDLGFDFDADNLYGIPSEIATDRPRQLFLDVLSGFDDERVEPELKSAVHKRFATLACKAAVKAGDALSQQEARQLVTELLSEQGGFTCPHGRPTHVEISPKELEKLFKRTGF